ncbi:hypothetical protein OIDMADRAFT_49543 [Oidiodendron maius Zn]|uniref:Uncharacterized protein n=1 Tax=Oidiodendron maius (strain Zn) TaxID=913774 RepID=A0A0C3HUY7_OIDMZ|nr:hypothetical protein OIDMADRAFT_49543 [Oidiodendron maius Zn]
MKRPKTIEGLSQEDLHKLAHLLSLTTDTLSQEEWLRNQAQYISTLSPTLQKCPSLLSRLTTSLPLHPERAYLCTAHRALNPYLIRHIFLLICAESTIHLTRLVKKQSLSTRISEFIDRLHCINTLWMTAGLYHLAFGEIPTGSASKERIASGCEACILAAVGGDRYILSDLHASLIGRKKKRRPVAELLTLVEAWIDRMARAEEVYAQSEALGAEILRCRREMQKARRKAKTSASGESMRGMALMVEGLSKKERDVNDEHDLEGSIIDFYSNFLSSTILLPKSISVEEIHPAFRSSIVVPPAAEAIRKDLFRRSWQTTYSESIYSNSTGVWNDAKLRESFLEPNWKSSDEYAEEYKQLFVVGVKDDKEVIIVEANKDA